MPQQKEKVITSLILPSYFKYALYEIFIILNPPSFLFWNFFNTGYKGGTGLPPWKRHQKKGLGRQAEATLESVWERTQWPSDDTISSMWDLHRVRREQVVAWFQERRRAQRGGGTSKDTKQGGVSTGTSTDWDAQWDVTLDDLEDDSHGIHDNSHDGDQSSFDSDS